MGLKPPTRLNPPGKEPDASFKVKALQGDAQQKILGHDSKTRGVGNGERSLKGTNPLREKTQNGGESQGNPIKSH